MTWMIRLQWKVDNFGKRLAVWDTLLAIFGHPFDNTYKNIYSILIYQDSQWQSLGLNPLGQKYSLIPKFAMITLGVHYEPLNRN